MSTATAAQPQLVFNRNFRSIPDKPAGGVTLYAYLSFNEGIGPDRSHGSVSGHINLKQGGVKDPDVGNFVVKGTFAVTKTAAIVEYVAIHFESVPGLFGQQTIHGLMTLKGDWESGHVTYSYTARGGHPVITVPSQKVEELLLK
ncbi:MAG TPA: hypothetical protein VGO50_14200 [Pyrinomonadaceae bacterium]|jgi:hypothetical protein|nr:hypothetical protein [Pyrinomonadaceae bacterium]